MGAEGLLATSVWVRRTTSSSVIIGNMARARFVMAGNSEVTKLSSTESSSNRGSLGLLVVAAPTVGRPQGVDLDQT